MIDFNPLNNPDAFWQHLLMILGAIVLGYMIGHSTYTRKRKSLEKKLVKLSSDVESCLLQKQPLQETIFSHAHLSDVPTKDDLKILEGIGPDLEELLNSEGIYTFSQLGATPPAFLMNILQESGSKYDLHTPRTWPQQAALAHTGKWDDLKNLQDELHKGRYNA
jgi:predicted flap endonuclease-1-like 5' DNA nuclease